MVKRLFDVVLAFALILLFFWFIILVWIIAAVSTKSSGIFMQKRVGQYGSFFTILKFKTMQDKMNGDKYISRTSSFLRKSKLDELPQLINILKGDMSFVGPRPDVAGFYDTLQGKERDVLTLKPGLTGPASLKYYNEDVLLEKHEDFEKYNREVLFPDKVRINLKYKKEQSLWLDIKLIFLTILKGFR